jgi:prepilin-type N-terminal cleavage/methylation domain-containing protein
MNFFATRHRNSRRGFTLTEIIFTLAIGSFITAGVITSYVFCARGFRGLSNYNEMHEDGRRALDWFARDMRVALQISSCTSNQVVAVLPTAFNATGRATGSNSVTHTLSGGQWSRSSATTGKATLLAKNVDTLNFQLLDAAGNITTQAHRAVSIGVNAHLSKQVMSTAQTEDFLSAGYRLRNR